MNQGQGEYATLPKELKPEDVTIEQALELIVAKGGASPAKKSPSRAAGAKEAPAKKTTAEKPAAKATRPKAASKSKAETPA